MDAWREQSHGLQARFKKTNFVLNGSVDDIWLNRKDNSIKLVRITSNDVFELPDLFYNNFKNQNFWM